MIVAIIEIILTQLKYYYLLMGIIILKLNVFCYKKIEAKREILSSISHTKFFKYN